MIRQGTVQTELFLDTTVSFSLRLLQGLAALSTITFALGTFLPTKFSSVPVFGTLGAMSFLAFALSLCALSLPILCTSSTATLVLVTGILITSPGRPLRRPLPWFLAGYTAVQPADLSCIFMLGQIAVFAPPNLIYEDFMDSFHGQFLSMDPFSFMNLIQLLTIFIVTHQSIHENFLCPIGCNQHGLSKQRTPFEHQHSIFLQHFSRRRL